LSTRPLDQLSPESRAVLSLILLQSRSYADIATLLRLDEDDVRARAHTAARGLVESNLQLDPEVQERVIDYVLSEQTVSERERTRSILEDDPVARDWASRLTDGLAPLAKGKLPAIPGAEPQEPDVIPDAEPEAPDVIAGAEPEEPNAPESPVLERPDPAPPDPEPATDDPEPAATNGDAPAADPAPRVITSTRPRPEPPRGSTRTRLLVLALGALVLVAVIVIVAVSSSGGGTRKPSAASAPAGTQLALAPVAAGSVAGGSATVERQHGGLLLLLRGHGLPPNTTSDSYAVWLYNSQSDARLLGFVSPAVGASRSFTNSVMLPSDARSFHTLVLTVETVSQPSAPGRIVLRGALRLP
jgi:hypothetical protein